VLFKFKKVESMSEVVVSYLIFTNTSFHFVLLSINKRIKVKVDRFSHLLLNILN